MPDIADDADKEIQANLEQSLAQLKRQSRMYQPCGMCHFCGEKVTANRLFCDSECAEFAERERKARLRNDGNEWGD